MGHNLFPTLPNSIIWRDVVERLRDGARVEEVAALSAEAVEAQLRNAPNDPVYREAIRLLALIPMAAREEDPTAALRELGLSLSRPPDLTELVFAVGERLDDVVARSVRRDDFAELSRRALISTISSCVGDELPGLLDATTDDVARSLRRFSHPGEFTRLSRTFFTSLLSATLSSFLDRTLSGHVGPGERFAHVGERSAFDAALKTYCYETTRIVHEFSRGWYGKNAWSATGLTDVAVAGFGAYALTKILAEMKRKDPAHG